MSRLAFVFKCSTDCTVEKVVRMLTGKMIHVDIIPTHPDELKPKAYTCYMFEHFSENAAIYNESDYVTLSMPVTDEERVSVTDYLTDCVERKVPYNYKDIMMCALPGSSYLTDVPTHLPPTSLFCSQAVVLCLRKCLSENQTLLEKINKVNSRITTPHMLYELLKPFCLPDHEPCNYSDISQDE